METKNISEGNILDIKVKVVLKRDGLIFLEPVSEEPSILFEGEIILNDSVIILSEKHLETYLTKVKG